MAKTFIQLNSGRTKVLKGRFGGNSDRARADVDDNIKVRIKTRADKRFTAQLIADCDISTIAADVLNQPATKPQGVNEMLFDGEAEVNGNAVRYNGDDINVTMVLDANGRVLSAHCRSWM
ncbi:MAG: hypothetical protein C0465_25435 [Ralstonia sp.]|uniref:hypothetical protein n=1 Tax=Ralstonia sp. TaxID=54061 RepID=UPI00257A28B2|nr:hypothetical protein [Ralstonia sp.]MBA4233919.1 hypothetical protein [Ralstonia sp.]